MLHTVISGAQTGADRAGLDAALTVGLKTGGWMPKGFIALDGNHPEFAEKYGIKETTSNLYPPRTYANVRDADATFRLAEDFTSRGELCTMKAIKQYNKPYLDLGKHVLNGDAVVDHAAKWLIDHKITILNVAGNTERTSPGIYRVVLHFLIAVFYKVQDLSADLP